MVTSSASSASNAATTKSMSYLEKLNKKLQLNQDEDYWREFQTLAKPNLTSCIPPDMQRIVRSINERAYPNLYPQGIFSYNQNCYKKKSYTRFQNSIGFYKLC